MLIGKAAYASPLILKMLFLLILATGSLTLAYAGYDRFVSHLTNIDLWEIARGERVLGNGWFQAVIFVVVVLMARRLMYRLTEREVDDRGA